jgi:chemotaxis protein methyltransferase CheR
LTALASDLDSASYGHFLRVVNRLTGLDLTAYRPGQMRRRLEALRARVGAGDFIAYARLLERDPERLQELRDFLTINVTEFFRDTPHFHRLATHVLPSLLAVRRSLRVWSAACSVGAEPYSLAMLLMELSPNGVHRVVATDIDRTALARARRGDDYSAVELRGVGPDRLARFFVHSAETSTWALRPEVKRLVEFREQNLLTESPSAVFDLILCRNVVIYFTDEAKCALYERLTAALRPGGVLLLGATEVLPRPSTLGLGVEGPSLYRRVSSRGLV